MTTHLLHTFIATVLFIACSVVANFLPPLWQGVGGPNFRPQATTMAILILLSAVALRARLRWPAVDFVASLLCAEVVTLCVIAYFSGFTWLEIFDSFNLSWLAGMNVFIGAPWLLGLLIGSLLMKLRDRQSHEAA